MLQAVEKIGAEHIPEISRRLASLEVLKFLRDLPEQYWYVYVWRHPVTYKAFYVGSGKKARCSPLRYSIRNAKCEEILEQLGRETVVVDIEAFKSEKAARRAERACILRLRASGEDLTNKLAGGLGGDRRLSEAMSLLKHKLYEDQEFRRWFAEIQNSDKTRSRKSLAASRFWADPANKKMMSNAMKAGVQRRKTQICKGD